MTTHPELWQWIVWSRWAFYFKDCIFHLIMPPQILSKPSGTWFSLIKVQRIGESISTWDLFSYYFQIYKLRNTSLIVIAHEKRYLIILFIWRLSLSRLPRITHQSAQSGAVHLRLGSNYSKTPTIKIPLVSLCRNPWLRFQSMLVALAMHFSYTVLTVAFHIVERYGHVHDFLSRWWKKHI